MAVVGVAGGALAGVAGGRRWRVVNTTTSHLVVTGSIPVWVTGFNSRRPQQRERWGAGFNSRSPRGLVKFGHVLGKGLYWDSNP